MPTLFQCTSLVLPVPTLIQCTSLVSPACAMHSCLGFSLVLRAVQMVCSSWLWAYSNWDGGVQTMVLYLWCCCPLVVHLPHLPKKTRKNQMPSPLMQCRDRQYPHSWSGHTWLSSLQTVSKQTLTDAASISWTTPALPVLPSILLSVAAGPHCCPLLSVIARLTKTFQL